MYFYFFFFNDTATTEIYTLSLHDALPISSPIIASARMESVSGRTIHVRAQVLEPRVAQQGHDRAAGTEPAGYLDRRENVRSEEHTSELQSRQYLVCRLLLEKKKKIMH